MRAVICASVAVYIFRRNQAQGGGNNAHCFTWADNSTDRSQIEMRLIYVLNHRWNRRYERRAENTGDRYIYMCQVSNVHLNCIALYLCTVLIGIHCNDWTILYWLDCTVSPRIVLCWQHFTLIPALHHTSAQSYSQHTACSSCIVLYICKILLAQQCIVLYRTVTRCTLYTYWATYPTALHCTVCVTW